jgi:mannose-6-phosphate isomerase-like protein (cupin superfamily)
VTLDGQDYEIEAGMSVVIPRGVRHSTRNVGDNQLIYVFMEAFYQKDAENMGS